MLRNVHIQIGKKNANVQQESLTNTFSVTSNGVLFMKYNILDITPYVVVQYFFNIIHYTSFWFIWYFLAINLVWRTAWFKWCITINWRIPWSYEIEYKHRLKFLCHWNLYLISFVRFTQFERSLWSLLLFAQCYCTCRLSCLNVRDKFANDIYHTC